MISESQAFASGDVGVEYPGFTLRNMTKSSWSLTLANASRAALADPNNEYKQYMYWIGLAANNRKANARELATASTIKHPGWAAGWFFLGKLEESDLEDDKALEYFSRAIKARPTFINALESRAFQYDVRNDLTSAIADFEKCYALARGDSKQRMRIRLAKTYLKAKRASDSIRLCKEAKVVDPRNAFIREVEVDSLLHLKRWHEAHAEASRAIKGNVGSPLMYFMRAKAEMQLQMYDSVVADCTQFLNAKPRDTEFLPEQQVALDLRSAALAKLGKPELARIDKSRGKVAESSIYKDTIFLHQGKTMK